MALRTSAADVQEIIEVDSSIGLTPFMTVANSLVTEICTDSEGVEVHDATRMELIETWLSAHFYAIRDPRLKSQSLDFMQYKEDYQYRLGLNLQSTMYGQQVLLLDTSGGFANLNIASEKGKPTIGVNWLGTEL